ncbi:hypothetical protein [Raineyella sp.]|uniref:hypothetical protein n=1 Tax=Raineyella sp. TaxID=1911550 RepID=UPI002B1EBE18|nr:hypothetical protein [Raineyella sp.]MEA5154447.1 hypothetical protein [Raineyella sp.]
MIDVIAALTSFVAQPEDNYGAAFTLVSVFIRPGTLTVLLIVVLMLAWCWGDSADERARATSPTLRTSRKTPAATIAGWLAVVGGGLMAVLAVWLGALLMIDGRNWARQGGPEGLALITLLVLGLILAELLLVLLPVWLGVLVLRQRTRARYALIVYGVLAFVGIQFWPLLDREPLIGWVTAAIPALLIWAELRERGLAGSVRGCWRGVVLLVIDIPLTVIFAIAEVGTGRAEDALALALVTLSFTCTYVIMLWLAMWAVSRDDNALWAGLNASLVVAAPLLLSLLGLGATLIEVFAQLGAA